MMTCTEVLSWVLFMLESLLLLSFQECHAVRSHILFWNSTNPIFRIDNTDHIIDVNKGNQPWEYDQINLICPMYHPSGGQKDVEQYIIYSVTKEEFEACRILNRKPRVIAQCTKPHELIYFTITFRSFTPTPGGLEFTPGKDYFFISTSAKNDLHRKVGGTCSSHNMKVQFKIADNRRTQKDSSPSGGGQEEGAFYRPLLNNEAPERDSNSASSKLPMHYGDLSFYSSNSRGNDYQVGNDLRSSKLQQQHNDLAKHLASMDSSSSTSSGSLSKAYFPFIATICLLLHTTIMALPHCGSSVR